MITIISGGEIYKVKITEKETNSNYNYFASLFKGKEKMPIAGTTFKTNTQAPEIIDWAKKHIERQNIVAKQSLNILN